MLQTQLLLHQGPDIFASQLEVEKICRSKIVIAGRDIHQFIKRHQAIGDKSVVL